MVFDYLIILTLKPLKDFLLINSLKFQFLLLQYLLSLSNDQEPNQFIYSNLYTFFALLLKIIAVSLFLFFKDSNKFL